MTRIPTLKDTRFKAFFAISPGTARGFNRSRQFEEINNPVFILGTESDNITPVESYARKYHRLISNSSYYEFPGKAGHYVMLAEANKKMKEELPVPFADHPTVDRREIHKKVSHLALQFFKQNL